MQELTATTAGPKANLLTLRPRVSSLPISLTSDGQLAHISKEAEVLISLDRRIAGWNRNSATASRIGTADWP